MFFFNFFYKLYIDIIIIISKIQVICNIGFFIIKLITNQSMETQENEFRKVQGRNDIKVLSAFDTGRKSVHKSPKKEYLRCKLVRGHKRAIRQILSNIIPKTTIHKFNSTDVKAHSLWTLMIKIINKDSSLFTNMSRTESGPITDGRAKRSAESMQNSEKSFNAAFCKVYFSNVNVRESFFQYINLIFVDFDPATLCKKFDFMCCRGNTHSVQCMEKWGELYRYITHDMIEELSCEPFVAYHQFVKLPDFRTFTDFEVEEFFDDDSITKEVSQLSIYQNTI